MAILEYKKRFLETFRSEVGYLGSLWASHAKLGVGHWGRSAGGGEIGSAVLLANVHTA